MAAECVAGGCPIGDAGTCPTTLVTSVACRHLREPLTAESESPSSEPSSRFLPRFATLSVPLPARAALGGDRVAVADKTVLLTSALVDPDELIVDAPLLTLVRLVGVEMVYNPPR